MPALMPGAEVELHPAMTMHQIAVWCAYHRRVVRIDWRVKGTDNVPIAVVLDEDSDDYVPPFLKPQAG